MSKFTLHDPLPLAVPCHAAPPSSNATLRTLLDEMVERGASDVHLSMEESARLRIDGAMHSSHNDRILTSNDVQALVRVMLNDTQRQRFETEGAVDVSMSLEGCARFRINMVRQHRGVSVVIRHIPLAIPPLHALGLPSAITGMTMRSRGLMLVTGPTGSGKTTTLAALIDAINRHRRGHILTIEDPIEFIHLHQQCIVTQREVGTDTVSFHHALKYALRQDPDVILIGEMRDVETMQAALTIAETGHLVCATLHTNTAAEAIHRIVDVFPGHQHPQVRAQLAAVLVGVMSQLLVPRRTGSGRALAAEMLVATPAVRALIRDDKIHQLYSAMQTGRAHGMQTMNDALAQLAARGEVAEEECQRLSSDPEELLRLIRRYAAHSTA